MILCVDPLLEPGNGPTLFPLDPAIRYEILVDNDQDAEADRIFRFRFATARAAFEACPGGSRGRSAAAALGAHPGAHPRITLPGTPGATVRRPVEDLDARSGAGPAVDVEGDRVTMLVRMAPGSAFPGQRHAGDLCFDDQVMQAGDYQLCPAGSSHSVQSTVEGCVLLLVSSRHDERA